MIGSHAKAGDQADDVYGVGNPRRRLDQSFGHPLHSTGCQRICLPATFGLQLFVLRYRRGRNRLPGLEFALITQPSPFPLRDWFMGDYPRVTGRCHRIMKYLVFLDFFDLLLHRFCI